MLESIYNDFVQHTNLTESIYKSVFSNIGNVMNYVKDIRWESITYTRNLGGEEEKSNFDFRALKEVPIYVIELFRNVFENFYEIPAATLVELRLSYAGVPYIIQTYEGTTVFPEQIKFIKQYKLYELFIADTRVIDLFDTFDRCFSFINTFKTLPRDIFIPLLKRFENVSAVTQMRENVISETKNASSQLQVEELTQRVTETMQKLSEVKKKQDDLSEKKRILSDGMKSYEYLIAERYKLSTEADALVTTQESYRNKIAEIKGMLSKIDLSITDLNAKPDTAPTKHSDIEFLIKKKGLFEREKLAQETSLKDISILINDISGNIRLVVERLSEIEQYSNLDLETLETSLKKLDADAEKLYTLLLSLEAELKHQKGLAGKNSLRLAQAESAGGYGDVTLRNIENSNIIDHLSTPLHPASVTTVANYLRYYFVYSATVTAEKLISDKILIDAYIAQAVAVKLVLCRNFGVYFSQMFSPIEFFDNRIEKLIKISRS